MAFPTVTTTRDADASAAFQSATQAAGLSVSGLNVLAQVQLALANLLQGPISPSSTVPASQVTAGTFGSGAYTFPSTVTIAAGLTVTTGGITVSAGTTAVQALTATTGVFSSTITTSAGIITDLVKSKTNTPLLFELSDGTIVGSFSNSTATLSALFGLNIGGMSETNSSTLDLMLKNTTAPTGNPTGGVFIWAEAGALKARGTSGTVTTIAPA